MPFLSPQFLINLSLALSGIGLTTEQITQDPVLLERDHTEKHPPSWDAQFIHLAGFWSHYNPASRTSSWPFPTDLTTPELAMYGMTHNVLHDAPEPGDICLQWNVLLKTFVHSAVMVEVRDTHREPGQKPMYEVYTVEGDTNETGELYGGKAKRITRRMSAQWGDRFLRWADLTHEAARRERQMVAGKC